MSEPKKPTSGNWFRKPDHVFDGGRALVFDSVQGLRVLSGVDVVAEVEGAAPRPEFHISVSFLGRRASNEAVRKVLRDFGMEGAKEDNHHNGQSRHFWLPVGATVAPECPCVHTESPHDEGDGFVWRGAGVPGSGVGGEGVKGKGAGRQASEDDAQGART